MTPAELDRLRETLDDIAERLEHEALNLRSLRPREAAAIRTQCAKLRAALSWLPDPTRPINVT